MKLHHIGIAVRELDEAIGHYKLLGFKETARGIVEDFNVAISMLSPTSSNEECATKLELLQPLGESGVQKFIEERGEGMHHIAYAVPDITRKLEELKAQNVRLIDETPREGFGGHLIAFLHPKSFGGVLVELVEEEV